MLLTGDNLTVEKEKEDSIWNTRDKVLVAGWR